MHQLDNFYDVRKKMHDLIPGGCHTYSKGDDQFPLITPPSIVRGEGAWVWGLDNKKYLDCVMGLCSVSLGHAFGPVTTAVKEELDLGSNFPRPSVIELQMAEAFLENLSDQDMIKFAKNGSTATTAAVKLARAYTGKKLVCFPGNHPFYSYDDWFIGTTTCSRGVPEEISSLSVTFQAYDIESLKNILAIKGDEIACLISEPTKSNGPSSEEFWREAQILLKEHNIVLIIDEMITGYRAHWMAAYQKLKIRPDLVTWGKGISNGFSFCALTGKRSIMELGGISSPGQEKCFLISTTHGGETHAIRAAMEVHKFFKSNNVTKIINEVGEEIKSKANKIISELDLNQKINISGEGWQLVFNFITNSTVDLIFKTLFCQKMVEQGVLFQGLFVPSYSHQKDEINKFLTAFKSACEFVKYLNSDDYNKHLFGGPVKPVFRKYV